MSEGTTDETGNDERSPEEIRGRHRGTREELGDTVEALAAKTDVKARAKAKVDETKETVSEKVAGIGDSARQAAPDSASAGAQQAAAVVRENPEYAALAGAFVAGIIAGWIIRGR